MEPKMKVEWGSSILANGKELKKLNLQLFNLAQQK
jgi:hypothetical protein